MEAHMTTPLKNDTGLSMGDFIRSRVADLQWRLGERAMACDPRATRFLRHVGSKVELRDLLVVNGLPRGAAEKIASADWPALSPANAAADVAASIRAAGRTLKP